VNITHTFTPSWEVNAVNITPRLSVKPHVFKAGRCRGLFAYEREIIRADITQQNGYLLVAFDERGIVHHCITRAEANKLISALGGVPPQQPKGAA